MHDLYSFHRHEFFSRLTACTMMEMFRIYVLKERARKDIHVVKKRKRGKKNVWVQVFKKRRGIVTADGQDVAVAFVFVFVFIVIDTIVCRFVLSLLLNVPSCCTTGPWLRSILLLLLLFRYLLLLFFQNEYSFRVNVPFVPIQYSFRSDIRFVLLFVSF